jgi:hypothetical protein
MLSAVRPLRHLGRDWQAGPNLIFNRRLSRAVDAAWLALATVRSDAPPILFTAADAAAALLPLAASQQMEKCCSIHGGKKGYFYGIMT